MLNYSRVSNTHTTRGDVSSQSVSRSDAARSVSMHCWILRGQGKKFCRTCAAITHPGDPEEDVGEPVRDPRCALSGLGYICPRFILFGERPLNSASAFSVAACGKWLRMFLRFVATRKENNVSKRRHQLAILLKVLSIIIVQSSLFNHHCSIIIVQSSL
eukprot:scpid102216/ scgid7316/ 